MRIAAASFANGNGAIRRQCENRRMGETPIGEFLAWEYTKSMHRVSAVLLMALFSFSLIPPSAFAADPESGLPACCRRNGKHLCAIPAHGNSSGPVLTSSRCPFYPGAMQVPASPNAGIIAAPVASGVLLPSHPVKALALFSF